jgi:hypothetical protein
LHDIETGLNYSRPLSPSRRTILEFGVGSTIVSAEQTSGEPLQGRDSQYRLVGDAGLRHELTRNWRTVVAYSRGVGFIEGVRELVYSDRATVELTGLVQPRAEFRAWGGVSLGDLGLQAPGNHFRTYAGSARLAFMISRAFALFGEYSYYFYDFNRIQLPPGVPSSMRRNGVRIGVTTWVPVAKW